MGYVSRVKCHVSRVMCLTILLQLHGGIERQNGGLGDTLTWEKSSDKKVQEAQSEMMMMMILKMMMMMMIN